MIFCGSAAFQVSAWITNIGWSGERLRRNAGLVLALDVAVDACVVVGAMARGALTVTVAAGDGVAAVLASASSWPPQELSRQGSKTQGSRNGLSDRRRIIGCSVELGGRARHTCYCHCVRR
ncbi:hypothetical protein XOCgx_4056 [Xanthomonas oryzae pv. oryzicola]|nr:hypothetical protein XOCgx_4056 [Xanthomonas oryzae pv. oryzicola]